MARRKKKNTKHADLMPHAKGVRGPVVLPTLLGAGRGFVDNDGDEHPGQAMGGTMPDCPAPSGGTTTGTGY